MRLMVIIVIAQKLTEYLDGVHLVSRLLVTDLTNVVAGVLRANPSYLQIIVADDLKASVSRYF